MNSIGNIDNFMMNKQSKNANDGIFNDLLQKLQCALNEEIDYVKKELKVYSIEAVNGILIASMGDSYIYQFELSTTLPPLEDSEVNIAVKDIAVSGTIVRLQGFEIEIMVKQNLGKAIPKARFSLEPTWLLEKLLNRLVEIKGGELHFNKDLSLKTIYPPADVQCVDAELPQLTHLIKEQGKETLIPRPDQLNAIRHSASLDISFVWGPPGTGKTTTLAWLVEALLKKDKQVLVVAHANVAVDNAIEMIVELLKNSQFTRNHQIIRFPRFRYTRADIRALADFEYVCDEETKELEKQEAVLRERRSAEDLRLQVFAYFYKSRNTITLKKKEITDIAEIIENKKCQLLGINNSIESIQRNLVEIQRRLDKAVDSNALTRFFMGLNADKLKYKKNVNERNLESEKAQRRITQDEIQSCIKEYTSVRALLEGLQEKLKSSTAEIDFECPDLLCRETMKIVIPSSGKITCRKCMRSFEFAVFALPDKLDIADLERSMKTLKDNIIGIEQEMKTIREKIENIKARILSEAKLIATTLTKVHIAPELYQRSYDAVILDEASMAPLPSIFFTAGLAKEKYAIFGDFCQLGPICRSSQAPDNECSTAKDWLGCDIYLKAGIVDDELKLKNKQRVVPLIQQSRMISSISDIVKRFIYKERGLELVDVADDRTHEKDRIHFYDTSQWNPWCSHSSSWSHYNVRQALLTLEIAKKIEGGRRQTQRAVMNERRGEGRKRDITIITPYREQARLLKALINVEEHIGKNIHVSSIHQFQGRETNRLVLDFVDGSPLKRIGKPFLGVDGLRLLNVALSRAKNEMHIVCNYDYFKKKTSAKSQLVLSILDFIKDNYKVHHVTESTIKIDSDSVIEADKLLHPYTRDRMPRKFAIYTHENFDPQFRKDVEEAERSVIICSPFLTDKRVSQFMDLFYAKAKQGVKIGIYTRRASRQVSSAFGDVKQTIDQLRKIGVQVLESERSAMHEKILIIDNKIVWDGSLNTLSHGGYTSESMLRMVDDGVASMIMQLHGLGDFFERVRQIERRDRVLQKLNAESMGFCPKCFKPIKAFFSSRQRCLAYHCSTGELHHFKYVPGETIIELLDEVDRKCPKCGKPIISRTIQKGRQLLGCSGYPDCHYILNF